MPQLPQKLVVELIGTFIFVLTIGLSVKLAGEFAPLAIGSALMVMVYAGGHISGGHYNPAVSLAVFVRGKLPSNEMFAYWGAQVAGAIGAGLVFLILEGDSDAAGIASVGDAFIVELLFTFALAWVVLHVATDDDTDGNSFYGLAIGFTVLAGAFAVGTISGAAFNPAVAIGIIVMGLLDFADIWIFLIACLAGGALAALAYNFVRAEQSPRTRTTRPHEPTKS